MMLKANGEYLDFRGDIEIEKKIKIFEDIETADGDLSFAFELNLTSENLRILQIPIPDSISKIVYHNIPCEVQSDQGLMVNIGSLRIERIIGRIASCSFLGGNSNWFAMLDGDMTELRLSQYDVEQNEANITGSWIATDGLVFPMIDIGTLVTRGFNNVKNEDFVGCFYLHTLFKELFQQSGIKLDGDFLNDPLYNQIVICSNNKSAQGINDRSCFVGKNISQAITSATSQVTFQDETTNPYFDGATGNFASSQYTADIRMRVKMEVNIITDINSSSSLGLLFYVSGVEVSRYGLGGADGQEFTKNIELDLDPADYIQVFIKRTTGSNFNLTGGYIKITPVFLYKAFGNDTVPKWTKQQFVSNVFRAFNVLPSYNSFTKTLTLDLFDKIKTKESKDLSDYINVDTIDYTEFISNYAKINTLKYQDGSDEDLKQYNISSFIKYGSGQITADNDFLEDSTDVVSMDITTPISYLNPAFNGSLERINFVELQEDVQRDITSVSDASGVPRFNVSNAGDYFTQNDLVRISSEDSDDYNGDFVVTNTTSTYFTVRGLGYNSSITGKVTKLLHVSTGDDNVYWFITIPYRSSDDVFGTPGNYFNQNFYDSVSIAFFNLMRLGHAIEDEYKQGLSFGEVDSQSSYQKTLIDTYWQQFSRILNDPVKLLTTGYLPWKVYNSLDFLSPVSIKTLETTNLYYVNRIVGYKDSSVGCEVDLIKLP